MTSDQKRQDIPPASIPSDGECTLAKKVCDDVDSIADDNCTGSRGVRIDDDESRDDVEEDYENNMDLSLSVLPSQKERKKDLTCVMANLKTKLHDLDWTGFERYATNLLDRHPGNADYKACVLVHRPYAIRIAQGAHSALKYLEGAQEAISQAPSGDLIRIKYLTMKAFLLYFLGRRSEALGAHQLAIQESVMCEANSSSAHNLYYYSLNTLLHNPDKWTANGVPMEVTWTLAEASYRLACDMHKRWVEDLEDDTHLSGENSAFFFLITMSKYIMCLLRTCAAPEGFFRLMTTQTISRSKLETAQKNLVEVERDEGNLSKRGWLYYCLAYCDYYIRLTQLYGDGNKNLTEARSWAQKSLHGTDSYKVKKVGHFVQVFAKCRFEYIDGKLKNNSSAITNSKSANTFRSHLVPLKTSMYLSHLDTEKETAATPEYLMEHHQVTDDSGAAMIPKCTYACQSECMQLQDSDNMIPKRRHSCPNYQHIGQYHKHRSRIYHHSEIDAETIPKDVAIPSCSGYGTATSSLSSYASYDSCDKLSPMPLIMSETEAFHTNDSSSDADS